MMIMPKGDSIFVAAAYNASLSACSECQIAPCFNSVFALHIAYA